MKKLSVLTLMVSSFFNLFSCEKEVDQIHAELLSESSNIGSQFCANVTVTNRIETTEEKRDPDLKFDFDYALYQSLDDVPSQSDKFLGSRLLEIYLGWGESKVVEIKNFKSADNPSTFSIATHFSLDLTNLDTSDTGGFRNFNNGQFFTEVENKAELESLFECGKLYFITFSNTAHQANAREIAACEKDSEKEGSIDLTRGLGGLEVNIRGVSLLTPSEIEKFKGRENSRNLLKDIYTKRYRKLGAYLLGGNQKHSKVNLSSILSKMKLGYDKLNHKNISEEQVLESYPKMTEILGSKDAARNLARELADFVNRY